MITEYSMNCRTTKPPYFIFMIQTLYKRIFWIGYITVLITAFLALPWQLDKIKIGTIDLHIRLDHLLHLLVYFLICMYFFAGQRNGLILFRHHARTKFLLFIIFLATVTEVVQLGVPYRSFNPMDWVANLSGVIIGLLVMYLLRRRKVIGNQ
jgi:VanZ family protein